MAINKVWGQVLMQSAICGLLRFVNCRIFPNIASLFDPYHTLRLVCPKLIESEPRRSRSMTRQPTSISTHLPMVPNPPQRRDTCYRYL
jgi:hypothetical protein